MVDEIQQLAQQTLNNHINLLEYKKLQIKSSWNYDELIEYLSHKVEGEFRLWKMDSSIDIPQMKTLIIRTIHNGKLNLKGEILKRNEMQLTMFLKSHYTLVID